MNEAIFQPAPPSDSSAVLYMYAVASRVVCNEPEVIDTVTSRLDQAVSGLVPPESLAAGDCQHLWALFSRVARPDLLSSVNMLAREVSRWTAACDRRLHRLICYMHQTQDHACLLAWGPYALMEQTCENYAK